MQVVTVTRRTRIYKQRQLQEVDTFAYEMQIPMQRQVAALLSQGFVCMGGTMFTRIVDLSKEDRHVVTVKLEDGAKLNGMAKCTTVTGAAARALEKV